MRIIPAVALAAAALTVLSASSAQASNPSGIAPIDLPPLGEVTEVVPDEFRGETTSDGMSLELTVALANLERDPIRPSLNLYEWSTEKQLLTVHAFGNRAQIERRLSVALPSGTFEIVMDPYPIAELSAFADRIARQQSIDGIPIAYAGPRVDGTGIEVGVVTGPTAKSETLARVEAAITSQGADQYPVTVIDAAEISADPPLR